MFDDDCHRIVKNPNDAKKMPLDPKLIAKYNLNGPRYTSYPTAVTFTESFTTDDYVKVLESTHSQELSLYIHIPFCSNICYYCACNKVITKNTSRADEYIEYLTKEFHAVAQKLASKKIGQIHFGGGTPTFLSNQQIESILNELNSLFEVSESAEISIEIDPRTVNKLSLPLFRQLGMNRISFGIQDLNTEVQSAVNRVCDLVVIKDLMQQARNLEFKSINMDLIYGLPLQTETNFAESIRQVIELKPDRIALYNYAHMPHRFKPQRRIKDEELPASDAKVRIFQQTTKQLTDNNYVYIGMDHFALSSDSLSQAQENGELHRNFQGYTTHKDFQLVGFGVSAISNINNVYSQNVTNLEDYFKRLDSSQLPAWRGCQLSDDDSLRRDVIMELICNFSLNIPEIEARHKINFVDYFATELTQLDELIQDGLVSISNQKVIVSELGRYFIRNICMAFDKYLQNNIPTSGQNSDRIYSKVI